MSDVSAEDQLKICEFSKYFDKLNSLKELLAASNKKLQDISDAKDEVISSLDPPLYKAGDCFYRIPEDELEEILEQTERDVAENIKTYQADVDNYTKKSLTLKTELYSKFGNRINLD